MVFGSLADNLPGAVSNAGDNRSWMLSIAVYSYTAFDGLRSSRA